MADIIKMNYALMEETAQCFHQLSDSLEDTISEMNRVAQFLSDGALLGVCGLQFEESIRALLISEIQLIKDKALEVESDLRAAVDTMRAEDTSAAGFVGC